MIGVKRDMDGIVPRDDVRVLRHRSGARDHVIHARARQELSAAGGDLHDPVALRIRESAQSGIEHLARRDVDRRVRETAGLRPVEHLSVHIRGRDWHDGPS